MSFRSPLLKSPPLWHTEELLAGQSSYHKNNTSLKEEKFTNWEHINTLYLRKKILAEEILILIIGRSLYLKWHHYRLSIAFEEAFTSKSTI